MAIDVCSEIPISCISPRISFSYDLNQTDEDPHPDRLDSVLLETSSNFDFCINSFLTQEISSADELFSNGRILPVEIKPRKKPTPTKQKSQTDKPVPVPDSASERRSVSEKKRLKEFLLTNSDSEEKPTGKSFWQFKRSSSLNCESGRSRSLIRSLQFLSRSNSTGSSLNSKETQKPNLQKQASISSNRSSSSCPSSYQSSNYNYSYSSSSSQRKSFGSQGNGVRISPVLNLPPPYISKVTVSFFGIGSLFCNGKIKKKKK